MTLDYRCPTPRCGRKSFVGPAGVEVELKCQKCKQFVIPVADAGQVLHRTYECETCRRKQYVELPLNERLWCMVCGTQTLAIIAEVKVEPAERAVERAGVLR